MVKNLNQLYIVNKHSKDNCKLTKIKLDQDKKCLPIIYWLPNPLKTSTYARYIIATPRYSLKRLSKAINNALKLLYNQIESYSNKRQV